MSARTFTVRQPGCAAWSGPGLSLAQARRDLREAIDRGLTGAAIVADDPKPDARIPWASVRVDSADFDAAGDPLEGDGATLDEAGPSADEIAFPSV